MDAIYFASSNENKFEEIRNLCKEEKITDFQIYFKKIIITEIQSESILEVSEDKVKKAFEIINKPVIVEDDGLFIQELNGFPGIYSSFVFEKLGNEGILCLLSKKENRKASFFSVCSFYDDKVTKSFIGETLGSISLKISPGGWGFDPIFIPKNENITFSQMDISKKNKLSHRTKAFKKFLEWYIDYDFKKFHQN